MLTGPKSCGKTTTLTNVYDKLVKISGVKKIKSKTVVEENPDFECILLYEGKKIAIFSLGDLSTKIIAAINKYEEAGMDVLIIACNEQFKIPFMRINDFILRIFKKKRYTYADDEKIADKIIAML
jgi:aspartate/glutamate racemase